MDFQKKSARPLRRLSSGLCRRLTALFAAAALLVACSVAYAQESVDPDSSPERVKPGEQKLPRLESAPESDDDEEDRKDQEPDSEADESKERGSDREWVREFDSVDVERIDPEEYSETAQPGGETGIRTEGDELPEPASEDRLRSTVERIRSQVVQVVAVQVPPRPYRADPMAFYGHGLWVQADDDDSPRLITAMSWLRDADEIFVIPNEVARSARDQSEWQDVHRRSLESVTAGDGTDAWLADNEDKLVPARVERADKHKNLVTLRADGEDIEAPDRGMRPFDPDDETLFRAYGFTPYFGDSLVSTTILPDHPEKRMLAFYWQTTFPAILGAPLLTEEGDLVAINTFRHPHREDVFLSIPADAVDAYLRGVGASSE